MKKKILFMATMVCVLFTLTACPDGSEFDISDGSQPPVTASRKKLKSITVEMPNSSSKIKTTINYSYDKVKRVSTIYYHYPSSSNYHLTISFMWDSHKIYVEERYDNLAKNRTAVFKFNLNKLGFITEIVPLPDESSKNIFYIYDYYTDWYYKYEYNGNYLSSITVLYKNDKDNICNQRRFENNEKENFTNYDYWINYNLQGEITNQSDESINEYSCSPIENIGNISYINIGHISPLLYFSDARYTTGFTDNTEICNLLQIATGLFGKVNKYIITTCNYYSGKSISCQYTHDNDNYITSIRALRGPYDDKSISLIWE